MMKQQCFSSFKIQLLNFHEILYISYKIETKKIINLLNYSTNEEFKFATKNDYVINSQTTKSKHNQNNSIKFETESIKSSLCDYSNTFSYRRYNSSCKQ